MSLRVQLQKILPNTTPVLPISDINSKVHFAFSLLATSCKQCFVNPNICHLNFCFRQFCTENENTLSCMVMQQARIDQDTRICEWLMLWSSEKPIKTCLFHTCHLSEDFCMVSSASAKETLLFPHRKVTHICSHTAYQIWTTSMESDEKNVKKARPDGWIALFDLSVFLSDSATVLSTWFG